MKFRRRYDVPVEITIPDELMLIPMDAILIEQVIVNLLENSVLHGKTTTLIKLTLSSDGENAVFSVADSPEEKAANAFQRLLYPCRRAERRREEKHGNRSLGLPYNNKSPRRNNDRRKSPRGRC